MNLRYLEILETIEEIGTFTGAAKKLHLTQSAISHAIAELEKESGTALFDRLPRGVRLTQCGSTLLEESRGILAACRNLEQKIHHLEEYTSLNLVSSITIALFLLPKIITEVKKQIPTLQIKVKVVTAAAALDILQKGEADIAFLEGTEPDGAFRTITLGSYQLYAACTPHFPIPDYLTPKELCTYPLLLREQGSAIRDTFDSMLSLANQKAYPLWESVNSLTLIEAAEAGFGITVLPDRLLRDSLEQNRLKRIKLNGLIMENKMLAVLHKEKYITQPLQTVLDAIFLCQVQNK